MNKLNSVGEKLIDYKHEYDKSSSQVIKDALMTSLEVMIQQKIIDENIKKYITGGGDDSLLIQALERDAKYKKSPRELFKEYEKIRDMFESCLREIGLQGFFETESSIEFNRISVLKQYSIDKTFIMDYFGIKEIDLIQLMKKRGFAEKFAVLRMNLVFDEILEETKVEDNIIQSHSMVYYNPDITGFSIDYKYHINVDMAEDPNSRIVLAKRIAEIDKGIENKYKNKIGIKFYSQKREKAKDVQVSVTQAVVHEPKQEAVEKTESTTEKISTENNQTNTSNQPQNPPQTKSKSARRRERERERKAAALAAQATAQENNVDEGFQEISFDKPKEEEITVEDNKTEQKTEEVKFSFDDLD